MSKEKKMAVCGYCGAEIAANAKVCPQCGGKQKKPIYKRWWFVVLAVVLLLGIIGSVAGGSDAQNPSAGSPGSVVNSSAEMQPKPTSESEPEEIVYTAYSVSELMQDLDQNALKASEKYKGQFVELTGALNVIDSSGKYISIRPEEDPFAIIGVTCYLQSEEQKSSVMELSVDDTVVVRGKIKKVGEVLGYSLDIDEIVSAG